MTSFAGEFDVAIIGAGMAGASLAAECAPHVRVLLVEAGGRKLEEAMDLHFAAMGASRQKKPLELTILRSGQTLILAVPLD